MSNRVGVVIVSAFFATAVLVGCGSKSESASTDTTSTTAFDPSESTTTLPLSPADAKFITASPVDLSQINSLSKFRSCAGHDYSGTNIEGVRENLSSMKHYAIPDQSLANTNDKIKLFAPFDGALVDIGPFKNRGRSLKFKPDAAPEFVFNFGHTQPLPEMKLGDNFKAGDLVGYGDVTSNAASFDLELWNPKADSNAEQVGLDSLMNHLTPTVAAEFATYGFVKATLVIPLADRLASPCKDSGKKDYDDVVFVSDGLNDYVVTSQPLTSGNKSPGAASAPSAASDDNSKSESDKSTGSSDKSTGSSDQSAPSGANAECESASPPPGCAK